MIVIIGILFYTSGGNFSNLDELPSEFDGKNVIYITNYLDRDDYIYSLNKNDLFDYYLPHIKMINNLFDKSWVLNSHYNSLSAAQPIITTDYSSQMPSHNTPFDRLYLANTTQIYPEDRGTNYSIKMGREVAQKIIEDISLNKPRIKNV